MILTAGPEKIRPDSQRFDDSVFFGAIFFTHPNKEVPVAKISAQIIGMIHKKHTTHIPIICVIIIINTIDIFHKLTFRKYIHANLNCISCELN